ncbi:MAG TPA: DUF1175 family protein [Bryobacteraceae bacterium]|nr:DUF1175 family protein [Bryobacteraceae bacterium]
MIRTPVIALCALAFVGCNRAGAPLRPEPANIALTANGFSSARLALDTPDATIEVTSGARRIRVESVVSENGRTEVLLRAGVLPGDAVLQAKAPRRAAVRIPVMLSPDDSDRDGDGVPDVLLLTDEADRAAFTHWFTFLAEAQYAAQPLPAEVNDCAALVRFAYREALREHDTEQAAALRLPALPASGGVRKYQFPFTPLGSNLFRTPAAFTEFADAETLMRLNTWLVSRDIARAAPGDLLFFRQLEQSMPFHVMIYAGPSQLEPDAGPVIVYHTGPIGKLPGEIRRPTVSELLAHPSPRWRPVPGNSNFLGFFRWNILNDL